MKRCADKECRRPFEPANPKHFQKFCSEQCRQRSNRRRNRRKINARRRKKPVLMKCGRPGCDVYFFRRGPSRRIYCTLKCGRAARRQLYSKICLECHAEFGTPFKRKIFCSRACKKRAAGLADRRLLRAAKAGVLVRKPVSPGRPKLAPEETRMFEIGQAVERFIQPATMALKIIAKLSPHSRGDLGTFRDELLALGFKKDEVPLAQFARTAKQLSRRVVTGRENMTEASVTRYHQGYLCSLARVG